jgi:hypothetical protein
MPVPAVLVTIAGIAGSVGQIAEGITKVLAAANAADDFLAKAHRSVVLVVANSTSMEWQHVHDRHYGKCGWAATPLRTIPPNTAMIAVSRDEMYGSGTEGLLIYKGYDGVEWPHFDFYWSNPFVGGNTSHALAYLWKDGDKPPTERYAPWSQTGSGNLQSEMRYEIRPTALVAPRDGDLIKVNGVHAVYAMLGGQRHWIQSPAEAARRNLDLALTRVVASTLMKSIPVGDAFVGEDGLPDGLVAAHPDGRIFVLEGGKRRYVPDPVVFERAHFRWSDVVEISAAQLDAMPEGLRWPGVDGDLVKMETLAATYLVWEGQRHWVPDAAIATARGVDLANTMTITNEQMRSIPVGDALVQGRLPDGLLATDPEQGGYWFIEHGTRRQVIVQDDSGPHRVSDIVEVPGRQLAGVPLALHELPLDVDGDMLDGRFLKTAPHPV